jgi:hypothetical protein
MIVKFKIKGMPKDSEFNALPFGRQIEYAETIKKFKETTKNNHVSQKRTTNKKALKEFFDLHNVDQYYCKFEDSKTCRDDSFEIWFTQKS